MAVNFMDVVIKTKNGRLSTDLYSKPVESHQKPSLQFLSRRTYKKIYHLQSNFKVKENSQR